MKEDGKYIAELLDIEHYYGVSRGRVMPVVIFLFVSLTPAVLYFYNYLYLYINVGMFLIFYSYWVIRSAMIILGRERERLVKFKERLLDKFESPSRLIRVRKIYNDGCTEMTNGVIKYFVCCYNKTISNPIRHSCEIRKFQESLIGNYDFDILVHNITQIDSIDNRYENIKFTGNKSIAEDFLEILDYNRSIVNSTSKLTRTVYVIRGLKSDWKDIKAQIISAVSSEYSKCYKIVEVLTNRDDIEKLMSRDVNLDIDIDKLVIEKYKTNEFHSSKILYYDNIEEDDNIKIITDDFHIKMEDRYNV